MASRAGASPQSRAGGIVVGVDGSPGSLAALRWAIREGYERGMRARGDCMGKDLRNAARLGRSIRGDPRPEPGRRHQTATTRTSRDPGLDANSKVP